MKFGNQILSYQEDILRDLAQLVAIPSVCSDALPGMPFGRSAADALGCILKMADGMGLTVKNVENYAGDARYGQGNEMVDILTHVDVVPAGDGWATDPFTLTKRGSFYFGRGTADDKGAAIVSLYCLKALKDAGVTGKRCLRTVFGAGEEISSNDLDVYYASESYPVMGFTPDCSYGVCNCEKEFCESQLIPLKTVPKWFGRFSPARWLTLFLQKQRRCCFMMMSIMVGWNRL